ncbi:MAG: hypothetical protein ACFCVF_03745 [Kineosporiaceae bacterium]
MTASGLTRRHVLADSAALAGTALTGCGTDGDASAGTSATAASGGTRSIEGVQGRTYELTEPPRRPHVSGGADLNKHLDALTLPRFVDALDDLLTGGGAR